MLDPVNEFDKLYSENFVFLVNFIRGRVHDLPLAEDLAQESFLSAFKRRESFKPEAPFRAYMVSIAKNRIIDNGRRIQVRKRYSSEFDEVKDSGKIDNEFARIEARIDLIKALKASLTKRERLVLQTVVVDGKPYSSLFKPLGTKYDSTILRIKREALRKLRKRLNAKD